MESNKPRGALEKGIDVLLALGEYPEGAGVSELSRRAGLPVSTVHRLLGTLSSAGFARFEPEGKRYTLGFGVFELAHKVSAARGLSEVALPVMRRLVKETGEPSLLSVPDGLEMVYVERVEGWRRIQIRGAVGERGPLYCTSLGKAMLAFMPEEERESLIARLDLKKIAPNTITDPDELRAELDLTRRRGYGLAEEEREEGVRSLGAPILGSRGWPVAAVCISAPVFRVSLETLERFAPMVKEAAAEIGIQVVDSSNVKAEEKG